MNRRSQIIFSSFIADFMRPVVVLGALADLIRLKLLEEMPDRFDVPSNFFFVFSPLINHHLNSPLQQYSAQTCPLNNMNYATFSTDGFQPQHGQILLSDQDLGNP